MYYNLMAPLIAVSLLHRRKKAPEENLESLDFTVL